VRQHRRPPGRHCRSCESGSAHGQLPFDEAVAVEVIGGLERKERGHPHHHRTKYFVADVEVIMGEAAALVAEDTVVRARCGIFRHGYAEGRPLLHALEDEVDAVGVLLRHATLPGQDLIFLADPLLGPLNRDMMIAGEGLNPVLVGSGTLNTPLLTAGTPMTWRKKCTTCSGRDRPLR